MCTQLELGSLIFDSMARLIYQCLEWHKQHQYYLSCTKLCVSNDTSSNKQFHFC